ncbi:tetratricopeptide repeat protein [Sporolactobacillus sp. STSJ-5]|uniref:tetratricopeptide repeat protein n=1 Tax=Sporolactobacillus sp. STSJ-5 TaxID=2965076 RepID=UPI0021083C4A|nr:tetratricopeptide repeat protein [Sporolactobacillus sp. STSJ-5]MCQ2010935.1 tetratricopeptide repeat protein [Sporolactobacillus sp. STSJ-5]
MSKELEKAISLRESGSYKESNDVLRMLVKKEPQNALINYHCAWSFDNLGEETKAVPYYECAIELGLPSDEMQGALLGLGSTYRTLGEYEKSKRTFLKGIELFPNNRAIQVFYAMTLYNLKEHTEAMERLLKCLIETTADTEILSYKRAIEFYTDKLDDVW